MHTAVQLWNLNASKKNRSELFYMCIHILNNVYEGGWQANNN